MFKKNDNKEKQKKQDNETENKNEQSIPLSIDECEKIVKDIFKNSLDIIIQTFQTPKRMAMIVYVDGLVNKDLMDRDIITPLKSSQFDGNLELTMNVAQQKKVTDFPSFVGAVLDGNTAIFYEKSGEIIITDLKQWDKRSVEQPDSEAVVRGPREGFTESFRSNTALLRRKIKTPKLIIENLDIGRQTNTHIGLAYIEGIVNQDVLKELKKRLSKIDTDAILESGYIEQYIEESSLSPLSSIGMTQKPDIVAAKILEGRVAIFCDGTPHVLTIPQLFIENIHSSEDYYSRVLISTFLRLTRLFALFISVLLPGLYVAVITYNQEMIPTVFLITLVEASAKIPLPAGAEMLFLIIMFELIRESGVRLPKTVGSAISIVGALIIGQAAVNAGIVGAPMIIIIALTSVSSLVLPNLTEFMTLYRFVFLFLGASMGIIGIGTGMMIMLTQLVSTKSFGIPILSSFSKEELNDIVTRSPLRKMKFRPFSIAKDNRKRNNM